MKEITEVLSVIAEERNKFHLRDVVVVKRDEFANSQETSSFLNLPEVYGRDEEKQKIVKVLVEDICEGDEVSVYPIIGMGGLGKTTLAQMAFNDARVKSHFELKIWVYVSQDFDVKRVIQSTIESISGKASEASDLDTLQRELRDILNGKRYLIVLDDVWNDNQEKWDTLKCVLACGSKGASVIVTTRLEMSGNQRLAELQHLDLGEELRIEHLERVRNSMDAKEANLIQKQKLRMIKLVWSRNRDWESQANVEQLLEALEPHPNVEELFIDHYKDFPSGGPVRGFRSLERLHISDLPNLKGLSREEGRVLLPRLGKIFIRNCPKLTLPRLSSSETLTLEIARCSNSNVMLSSISNLNCLTSLTVENNVNATAFPEEMLQNLTCLESLIITGFRKLKLLPSNLSSLVSLKLMIIEHCDELVSLPEHGLRSLKSLKHLEINHCKSLSSLSESFGHLTALEVLDVRGCPKLVTIPETIKHLNSLRHLTLDGEPTFRFLGEVLTVTELKTLPEALQHVTSLQSLSIRSYPGLTSLPDWLGKLSSLQSLTIEYCRKIQSLPEALQHATSLQSLSIHDLELTSLPDGLGKLSSLQSLTISDCWKIQSLPEALQHATSLQSLLLSSCLELSSLPEWLGNFSSLQSLTIRYCPKIQSLPQSIQSLTKLKTLFISDYSTELVRQCQEGNGEDWYKIAHIPKVYVDPYYPAKPKAISCGMIKQLSESDSDD
ncbi:hypothetical protein Vadar_031816 [Vaccinium darrowii]|uniref:Uncharacterized protein n=1 Tax=Vaccinium darrowii TaxID=229202 RepID=A0ACB7X5P9_9ERIC|nr:hypothetical protein Vadar_031816 [Vaccinium darrowii]